MVTVSGSCGVVFMRWVSPEEAALGWRSRQVRGSDALSRREVLRVLAWLLTSLHPPGLLDRRFGFPRQHVRPITKLDALLPNHSRVLAVRLGLLPDDLGVVDGQLRPSVSPHLPQRCAS